ncbi:MAG: GntR family transcriptional regulator [Clostridia bacterium]|nr:GntR family transcriptional regulator [Clostridia bacterium]MBQ6475780.1 GntR family transcriptional regulator [Clostridia bacterium]MBR0445576.1 GntR family transcriptional regulator [Clostridia bacterium]MCR5073960.1 GntR family transcriptional regulator [Clostridiales bacterium]
MRSYTVRPRESALENILAYIQENHLDPGDRLPAEREMCEMWQMNRSTLRSALSKLVQAGLLEVRHGSGIFLAPPKYMRMLQGLTSFTTDAMLQNSINDSRLISLEHLECDKRLGKLLDLTLGTPVWNLVRLRHLNGRVLMIDSSYFSAVRFPNIDRFDFETDSLYRVFEKEYGVIPTRGDELIASTGASEEEAKLLEIGTGAPIFRIESKTCDQDGNMLEYTRSIARPDRVVLRSTLKRFPAEEGVEEDGHDRQ